MMTIKAAIFDLDGTLLDTLSGIATSMNTVLGDAGLPTHEQEAYKLFVGDGVEVLAERALPAEMRDEATIEEFVKRYRQVYRRLWLELTQPYQGIDDMLRGLRERGARLAVLSNKQHTATRDQIKRYFPWGPFDVVFGAREGIPLKPDPQAALEISGMIGLPAEDFTFMGDTSIDMKTARAAGMTPIGAAWGFRSVEELREAGAALIIHTPAELFEHVAG